MTQERVAVVTGGTKGIGFAIASAFARSDWSVALLARSESGLAHAAAELQAAYPKAAITTVAADVMERGAVEAAFQVVRSRLGPVAALVNNAGTPVRGGFLETDPSEWERGVRLHVHGAYFASWYAAKQMIERGGGSIVNIASAAGMNPPPGLPLYAGAKGALIALTRAMAVDLASSGITVNAICPGPVDTETFRQATPPELYRDRALSIPLGRLIPPEDISETALFLCSQAATNMTGETIVLDGGAAAVGPYAVNLYKQRRHLLGEE